MFVAKQKLFSAMLCLLLILAYAHCLPAQEKRDEAPTAEGTKKNTPSIAIRGASVELVPASTPAGEAAAAASGPAGEDRPHLTIDAPDYNAGELWEGEDIIHTFTVKNTGKRLLEITNVKPG